jgi:hypothetical protein
LSIDVGLRDDRVLAALSDRTVTQWDARIGRRVGPTILLTDTTVSTATYSPDQSRIAMTVSGNSVSLVKVFSALDGDLLATFSINRNPKQLAPEVWFSADSRRVIVHQRRTTDTWSWTLPSYRGPLDQVPALVRLLSGRDSDPVAGYFQLPGDAIRTDPESYGRAFRAWKGLPDGPDDEAVAQTAKLKPN